jgi:2-oxo-3-hexenedioate decarboxylase
MGQIDIHALAREMLGALDGGTLVVPPKQRYPWLDFETAYVIAAHSTALRVERGERPVGRKVGYTNRNLWQQYDVHQPIWGHIYEHTLIERPSNVATLSAAGMISPRIEPEIAFKLSRPVPAGDHDPEHTLECVEWIARSFEVVDCHYEGWKFSGPDSVIDFGHHAALVVGEPMAIAGLDLGVLAVAMRDCRVTLLRDGETMDAGTGANALGHPAAPLAFLADILAEQPEADPLAAGEVISTGALTSAMPVAAGETWVTEVDGLPLPPLTLTFE